MPGDGSGEIRGPQDGAGGRPLIHGWGMLGADVRSGGAAYGEMIESLREMLDRLAAARPDEATIAALGIDLAEWADRLAPLAVSEREQIFSRRVDLVGRGQTMLPPIRWDRDEPGRLYASTIFGRYFLGGNGAAHGGAIALMFDEVLGRLANIGRGVARTAYLKTDYRAIAPIERRLDIRAWFVSEEGRKRVVRAELRDGETLCAEAEGLFVSLLPGQP
jgi:acyl-coenzyme A thioesterase PaaI-like protein